MARRIPASTDGERILRTHVEALFPARGPVHVLLYGEAPGPRGADQSAIPFWGDRAGRVVYATLVDCGYAEVPDEAWPNWDGTTLRSLRLTPKLKGAALSNAFPSCPTDDGQRFRSPKDAELRDPNNLVRIRAEVERARARAPGTLMVITFGKRAEWLFAQLPEAPSLRLRRLPHPSAQGLLNSAPDRGRGARLDDLEQQWRAELVRLLNEARDLAMDATHVTLNERNAALERTKK